MIGIDIRFLQIDEWPEIEEIEASCDWPIEDFDTFKGVFYADECVSLAGTYDDKLVAYAILEVSKEHISVARLAVDPEFRRKQAEAVAAKRRQFGRPSRSKHGLPYMPLGDTETRSMRKAIRCAGRLPSAADLVAQQQTQHWLVNATDRRHCHAPWTKQLAQYRYLVDQAYRLYHRQKSKHYKALRRGNASELISGQSLLQRWKQFDHCCAYCGAAEHRSAELEIEHVVPISKGGPHLLSNIVPACTSCNSSKRRQELETWMRQQPFFDQGRLDRIKLLCQ